MKRWLYVSLFFLQSVHQPEDKAKEGRRRWSLSSEPSAALKLVLCLKVIRDLVEKIPDGSSFQNHLSSEWCSWQFVNICDKTAHSLIQIIKVPTMIKVPTPLISPSMSQRLWPTQQGREQISQRRLCSRGQNSRKNHAKKQRNTHHPLSQQHVDPPLMKERNGLPWELDLWQY